jgi:hypothetical protein
VPKDRMTVSKYSRYAKSVITKVWATVDYERLNYKNKANVKAIKEGTYFDPSKIENYRIVANENGLATYSVTGAVVETGQVTDEVEWMYVMDVCGNIYVAKRIKNSFYHLDLAGYTNPVAAGRIQIRAGRIEWIDEQSGHFKFSGHSPLVEAELIMQDFETTGMEVRMWQGKPTADDRLKQPLLAAQKKQQALERIRAWHDHYG